MANEIEEIRKIVSDYLKQARNIENFVIIFARINNGNWKVVVRYSTEENPDMLSMLLVNITGKKVEYFRENISSY